MEKRGEIVVKIFIYAVWTIILILGIIDLFSAPYRSVIWFVLLVGSVVFYSILTRVPKYLYLILMLSIIFGIFGEVLFGFSYKYIYYDKILHLIDPLIFSLVIYHLAKSKIKSKLLLVIFCASAALSLEVIFEIYEYGMDNIFGTQLQGVYLNAQRFGILTIGKTEVLDKFNDTMLDLIYDFISVLIFMFGFYFYEKMRILKFNKKK